MITIAASPVCNGADLPLANRVRVVVDEDQGQNQRGMFWHFRAKHYSSATTAKSAYEAEALITLDDAVRAAKVGASGGTVVTHGTLSTNWTPVLGARLQGGSYLTHTGTNRIYARVLGGTTVQSRFVWDVGDLVNPVENDAVRCYDGGTFHILDLGEVRLDPPPAGTHRWHGQIQAKGDTGTESLSIDRVWIANQDESAGVDRAPLTIPQGLVSYSARSEFNTESGAITGDALAVGGNWTEVTGSDATDVSVADGVATRSADSDSGISVFTGRGITAGSTNYTALAVTLDVKTADLATPANMGVIARVVDNGNFARANLTASDAGSLFTVAWYIGGSASGGDSIQLTLAADTYYTIRLVILSDGAFVASCSQQGSFPMATLSGQSSDLATGGTLASGRVGIFDGVSVSGTVTRTYDNFALWVPTADAVVYASQSLELNTKGITREDSTGTAYGPVSIQNGDIPRMPNRSSAGTVEFMGKLSRGDLTNLADPGIDDVSVRIYRRASHLLLPN